MKKKISKTPKKTKTSKLSVKNSIFHKLLNSTMVLYLVFLVTCINIFNFIITKNDESLFLFILISVIIYEFNGNMILILGIPLVIVNLLLYLKNIFNSTKENFDEGDVSTIYFNIVKEISNLGYTPIDEFPSNNITLIKNTIAGILNYIEVNDEFPPQKKITDLANYMIDIFKYDKNKRAQMITSIADSIKKIFYEEYKKMKKEAAIGGNMDSSKNSEAQIPECSSFIKMGGDVSGLYWYRGDKNDDPKDGKDCAWANDKKKRKKKRGNLYDGPYNLDDPPNLICTNMKAKDHC